jgi:hypothetical protein
MLRKRTRKDNRQLAEGEIQFESVVGAVSAYLDTPPWQGDDTPVVTLCCVRGIESRKAQIASLDAEALDAFIEHLQALREALP